jgi:hypothetical protein
MNYLTVKDLKEFIKDLPDAAIVQMPGTNKYIQTFEPVEKREIKMDDSFVDHTYVTLNIGI